MRRGRGRSEGMAGRLVACQSLASTAPASSPPPGAGAGTGPPGACTPSAPRGRASAAQSCAPLGPAPSAGRRQGSPCLRAAALLHCPQLTRSHRLHRHTVRPLPMPSPHCLQASAAPRCVRLLRTHSSGWGTSGSSRLEEAPWPALAPAALGEARSLLCARRVPTRRVRGRSWPRAPGARPGQSMALAAASAGGSSRPGAGWGARGRSAAPPASLLAPADDAARLREQFWLARLRVCRRRLHARLALQVGSHLEVRPGQHGVRHNLRCLPARRCLARPGSPPCRSRLRLRLGRGPPAPWRSARCPISRRSTSGGGCAHG